MNEAETIEHWLPFSHQDLAARCAILHKDRRESEEKRSAEKIEVAREVVSTTFVRGNGIEVGAGARPFPVGENAHVFYGDIRDKVELYAYFGQEILEQQFIDAQTFCGIDDASQDFVISAHVIEHLHDPIGSIAQGMRVLRPAGIYVLVVPDMRYTFDVDRPQTTLDHLIADARDGGAGTLRDAYLEHMLYVHRRLGGQPVFGAELEAAVENGLTNKLDIHVHAWNDVSLRRMLDYLSAVFFFDILFAMTIVNENVIVMRKR